MHNYILPKEVESFINKYFNLNIKDITVPTPYFINRYGLGKNAVYAGKGDPYEIEKLANLKLEKINTQDLNADKIINLLKQYKIGIDCSGFVYNIYKYWLKLNNYDISHFLPKINILNIRKYISRKFKPQNSMSAHEFTSTPFANKLKNLIEVEPGYLLRTRGGKHVLFITRVVKSKTYLKELEFVHSAAEYKRNGVRKGLIILNDKQDLNFANWVDIPNEDINFAYKGYKERINNNGIYKPNIPIFFNKC